MLAVAVSAEAGMLQAGRIEVDSTAAGQTAFQGVAFGRAFDRVPVVFVLPTDEGADPAALRIRNVTRDGFEIAPVEPPGEDGPHPGMTDVGYLAVEPGRTEIEPGVFLDAGVFSTTTTIQRQPPFGDEGGYETVQLRHTFGTAPAVVAQIQTTHNEAGSPPGSSTRPWLTTSVVNIQTDRFDLAIERSETADGSEVTAEERIGYLAIERTSGSFDDRDGSPVLWQALTSPDTVRGHAEGAVSVAFTPAFGAVPIVVAEKDGRDGHDGGWLRRAEVRGTDIELFVDEDQFNDSDRSHTTEAVSIAAFERVFDALLPTLPITITWTGASGTGEWDDRDPTSNWDLWDGEDANLVPGDTLLFDDTGEGRTDATVDVAYTAPLAELRFEETTAYDIGAGGAGAFAIADGGAVTNRSSAVQTLDVPIEARGDALTVDAGDTSGGGFVFGSAAAIDLGDTGGVALTVAGANPTTFAGPVGGVGGRLVKQDGGTLTLPSANTFTGGTTLVEGRLVLGDNQALGTGPLTVTGPGTVQQASGMAALANDVALADDLTVEADADLEFAGRIIGAGSLTKRGAGTLSLTADNAFGGMSVAEGAVAGDTTTLTGDCLVEGRLVFDQAFDGVFESTLGGTGEVVKRGGGTLTLPAESPFAGTFTVQDGAVALQGSIAGHVLNRGRLCGTGTFGTLTNEAGGTFAPGNSIGITTVSGDYTQAAGSTLEVEVDGSRPRGPGSSHDFLDVDGTATLEDDSTVRVVVANPQGIGDGETLTVIEADGGVTDEGADLVTHCPAASLIFRRDPAFANGDTRWSIVAAWGSFLANARGTENRAIAGALDGVAATYPAGPVGDMLSRLRYMDARGLNLALDDLSPKPMEVMGQVAADAAGRYHGNLAAYTAARARRDEVASQEAGYVGSPSVVSAGMSVAGFGSGLSLPHSGSLSDGGAARRGTREARRWSTFAEGISFRFRQDSSARRTGFTAEAYGAQAGIDRASSDGAGRIGLGLAVLSTDVDFSRGRGDVEDRAVRVGPYVTKRCAGTGGFVDASLTYAFHRYETDRNVATLGLDASASHEGHEAAAYVGAGWDLRLGSVTVTPGASLQYVFLHREAYGEDGPAGLRFDAQDSHLLHSRLGVRVRGRVERAGMTLVPTAYLGWKHRLVTEMDDLDARFVAGGGAFHIDAVGPQRDALVFGAGLNARLNERAAVFVQYDGTYASRHETHSVTAGFRWAF
jgi:outer membrane autotransporter protein